VPLVDVLLVLVLILMLAGTVWGWLQGYARFDISTAVWFIVLAIVLLMVFAPWPVQPRVLVNCRLVRRDGASLADRCDLTEADDLRVFINAGRGDTPPWRPWRARRLAAFDPMQYSLTTRRMAGIDPTRP
jgi:hypothetical protein